MKIPVILLNIVLSLITVLSASARTWYILPDGTGDAPTIQAGIDSSAAGDTVVLGTGLYRGEGNKRVLFNGKAIVVTSEFGPDMTIIDCEGDGKAFLFRYHETASSVLSGLTITNGYGPTSSRGGAIGCFQAGPTIQNNVFLKNECDEGGAIDCWSSAAVITNNRFVANTAVYGGDINCMEGSPTISNNQFVANHAHFCGGGVCCHSFASPTIVDNVRDDKGALALLNSARKIASTSVGACMT